MEARGSISPQADRSISSWRRRCWSSLAPCLRHRLALLALCVALCRAAGERNWLRHCRGVGCELECLRKVRYSYKAHVWRKREGKRLTTTTTWFEVQGYVRELGAPYRGLVRSRTRLLRTRTMRAASEAFT